MYLHLGEETVVREQDIIGIFDLDNSTVSRDTRRFLTEAEQGGRVVNVTYDLPKTFVVTAKPGARARDPKSSRVYICLFATGTLKRRLGGRRFVK